MKYIGEDTLIKDINKEMIDDFIIQLRDNPLLNDMSLYTYARDFKTLMYFFMRKEYISKFLWKIKSWLLVQRLEKHKGRGVFREKSRRQRAQIKGVDYPAAMSAKNPPLSSMNDVFCMKTRRKRTKTLRFTGITKKNAAFCSENECVSSENMKKRSFFRCFRRNHWLCIYIYI